MPSIPLFKRWWFAGSPVFIAKLTLPPADLKPAPLNPDDVSLALSLALDISIQQLKYIFPTNSSGRYGVSRAQEESSAQSSSPRKGAFSVSMIDQTGSGSGCATIPFSHLNAAIRIPRGLFESGTACMATRRQLVCLLFCIYLPKQGILNMYVISQSPPRKVPVHLTSTERSRNDSFAG